MKVWSLKTAALMVLVLAVAAFAVAGCGQSSSNTSSDETTAPSSGGTQEVAVGSVLPMSGPISTVGLAWSRGYELYFNKVNSEGGVKIGDTTYTFNYIKEDGKGDAQASGEAAQKLISQDKAVVVFGEIMDGASAAIYTIADQNKTLQIMPSINVPASPADISPDKPLLARLTRAFDAAHTADLDYLKENYPNVKTITISQPDIGYEGMVADFTQAAEARGFQVKAVKWTFGTTDFVPTYTKMLATDPDAIFMMISAQSPYQLKAARQLGFKGPMFANSPMGAEVHVRVAGDKAATDFFCNSINPDDPTPEMAEIMAAWEETYGDEWVSDAVLAYDEAWTWTQAAQKAGSIDATMVMAALESMTNEGDVKSAYGDAMMGGADRFGVDRELVTPIPITLIMDGKMTLEGYFLESSNK
jgi:branched-chain amino acid transport system substrate-binding protein